MSSFNFALNAEDYTVKNALTWGYCKGHYQKAFQEPSWNGRRCIQLTAAFIQAWPIISQITSLFELMLFTLLVSPSAPRIDGTPRVEDSPAAVISSFKKRAEGIAGEIRTLLGSDLFVLGYFRASQNEFENVALAFETYLTSDLSTITRFKVHEDKSLIEFFRLTQKGEYSFFKDTLKAIHKNPIAPERDKKLKIVGDRALSLINDILNFHEGRSTVPVVREVTVYKQAELLANELEKDFGRIKNYFAESPVLFKAIQNAFQVYSKLGKITVSIPTPRMSLKEVFEKEVIADTGLMKRTLKQLDLNCLVEEKDYVKDEERLFKPVAERAIKLADEILKFEQEKAVLASS